MPDWYLHLPIIGHWPAWLAGAAGGALLAFALTSDKIADIFVRGFSGGAPLPTDNPPDRALLGEDPDRGTLGEWLRSFLSAGIRLAAMGALLAWLVSLQNDDYLNEFGFAGAVFGLLAASKIYFDQGRHGSMVGEPEVDEKTAQSDSSPAAALFLAAFGAVFALLEWFF